MQQSVPSMPQHYTTHATEPVHTQRNTESLQPSSAPLTLFIVCNTISPCQLHFQSSTCASRWRLFIKTPFPYSWHELAFKQFLCTPPATPRSGCIQATSTETIGINTAFITTRWRSSQCLRQVTFPLWQDRRRMRRSGRRQGQHRPRKGKPQMSSCSA